MLNVGRGSFKSDKILSIKDARKLIKQLKLQNKMVGLCHGVFDLLHPGHVKHFESAKKLCDALFVSVTSDKYVSSRKGSNRPIYTDKVRAYMAASIKFVDYVVISDFKMGIDVIKALKPNYYIKGPDYINSNSEGIIAEKKAISDVGGKVRYTNDQKLSTTGLIGCIREDRGN